MTDQPDDNAYYDGIISRNPVDFDAGKRAAAIGVSLRSNPHRQGDLERRRAWAYGYQEQLADMAPDEEEELRVVTLDELVNHLRRTHPNGQVPVHLTRAEFVLHTQTDSAICLDESLRQIRAKVSGESI